MRVVASILLLTATMVVADDRQPAGSITSWSVTTNSNKQITYHMTNHTSGSNWIVHGGSVPISLPGTYKDVDSGIIFFVEADGRHVCAISSDGKILWRRDPFADAHLELYRTDKPQIRYLGKPNKRSEEYYAKQGKQVIGLAFNSTQFGQLDIKTGDFFFSGQD